MPGDGRRIALFQRIKYLAACKIGRGRDAAFAASAASRADRAKGGSAGRRRIALPVGEQRGGANRD